MNCFPTKVGEIKGKTDTHSSEPDPISQGKETSFIAQGSVKHPMAHRDQI